MPTSLFSNSAAFHRAAPGAVPVWALVALALVLAIAVYMEIKEGRIPNWLTFPAMALGLLIGLFAGVPWLWSSVEGLGIGFGFLFIFYVFGGVGGGDVKLMGAAGALMGGDLVKPALFYTVVFGAFLAALILIWRKDFWLRATRWVMMLAFWRKQAAGPAVATEPVTVPYGVAIAVGCLLALFARAAG